jgi:hypothetical protein
MNRTLHELHLKFIIQRIDTKEIIAVFTSAERASSFMKGQQPKFGNPVYEMKESY